MCRAPSSVPDEVWETHDTLEGLLRGEPLLHEELISAKLKVNISERQAMEVILSFTTDICDKQG